MGIVSRIVLQLQLQTISLLAVTIYYCKGEKYEYFVIKVKIQETNYLHLIILQLKIFLLT